MTTITLQEAQANLPDLIHRLSPGEELLITENEVPVAKLQTAVLPEAFKSAPRLGTLRGTVLSMDHFDDPLEEFEEYQ